MGGVLRLLLRPRHRQRLACWSSSRPHPSRGLAWSKSAGVRSPRKWALKWEFRVGSSTSRGDSLAVHRPLRSPPRGELGRIREEVCCGCHVSSVGSWLGLQGPGEKVRVCGERQRKARVMSPPKLQPQAEPEGLDGVVWRGGRPPAGLESVPEPESQAGFSTSPGARPGDGLEPGDLSETA